MEASFHHALMKTYFAFHRLVMEQVKKEGLTTGQPKILEYLSEHQGVDQKTVADHCEIEAATVGNLLGRMESSGLIERRREEGNRRSIFVYLTPKGRKAAERISEIFDVAERQAFAGMGEEDVVRLRASLSEVYCNIKEKEA